MRMTSRQPREQQNSRASTGHHSLSSHTKTHKPLSSSSSCIAASETPSATSRNAHTKTPASQSKPTFKPIDPFGRPGRLIQSPPHLKKKKKDKTTPVVSPSQPVSFKPLLCCLALSMHLLLPQRGFHGLLMRAISRCRAVFIFNLSGFCPGLDLFNWVRAPWNIH
ncbi:hypothetical protein CI102_2989 [Trichoderma harzianum]|nr:hypothetical protein CI102_2989 [Trichoderma harzianum]